MNWVHTAFAQQIRFGCGRVNDAATLARDLGRSRIMLVTTRNRRQSAAGQRLASTLGAGLVCVFDEVRSHVPVTAVQAAVRRARDSAVDCIVSFGGGSCSDLGKAVCYLTEEAAGRKGVTYFDRPMLAHIAIPTGYSGAELTPFFGMTDEAARRKSGAGGPTTAPAAVIYDPEVTLDLPARVSAETGMNALAHCVEAAWSPLRTAEAEALAYAGAEQIYFWLPRVVEDPGDLDVRARMLEGAMLAGRCLQNASMGVHHGLAQLIGGRTGIAHGLANALILAHAVRFNADAVPDVIWRLAAAFSRTDGDAAHAIDELRAKLGLPGRLSECGVTPSDVDAVVQLATSNANIARNPKAVSEGDARTILEGAF
jgi:alcohol dehydrogenase class IV